MNDSFRNQLWADIYAQAHAKGRVWFQCKEEADMAVDNYDRRRLAPTKQMPQDYCSEKMKPGGCQLHNLHCGYPDCNAAPKESK